MYERGGQGPFLVCWHGKLALPVGGARIAPSTVEMPDDHVVTAVAIEVPDTGESPVPVGGKRKRGWRFGRHRLPRPAAVGMAQEHLGAAIGVEVTGADGSPESVGWQCRLLWGELSLASSHPVGLPDTLRPVAQEHVVATVAVKVGDRCHPPGRIGGKVGVSASGDDHAFAVHRVVRPTAIGTAQQCIVATVAVEVAGGDRAPRQVRR